jgi:hypothetical protein
MEVSNLCLFSFLFIFQIPFREAFLSNNDNEFERAFEFAGAYSMFYKRKSL